MYIFSFFECLLYNTNNENAFIISFVYSRDTLILFLEGLNRMKFYEKKLLIFALIFLFLLSSTMVFAQGAMEIMVHSVSAEAISGEVAYKVNVYLSVLESGGVPVQGLSVSDFSLTEDSQSISIDSVNPVMNEATNIVLVMDTSGSMSGQGIIDARNAAATFLERLGNNDQSAVISFNDSVSQVSSFSNNHANSSEAVKQLTAKNQAGTCLFDAAYQALELASTTPTGRRAVILFTDGKDETNSGDVCSFHTVDDVMELASNISTPVYTLGMGTKIESNDLKRIASNTGGSFLSSDTSSELDDLFSRLYDQLNNEYVLTYISTNAPGPHTVTVSVTYHNQQDQSAYNFTLPALPTTITFTSPAEGEVLTENAALVAKILTQGAEISSVEFASGGVIIGKDISEPYELDWDITNEDSGETELEVVAYGKNGEELARNSITVYINEEITGTGTNDNETLSIDDNQSALTSLFESKNLPYILGGVGLIVIVVLIIVFISRKKKNSTKDQAEEKFSLQSDNDDKTFDGISLSGVRDLQGEEIAVLSVIASDDLASIGHEYSISTLPVTLGRGAKDADMIFSGKDQAISRKHAIIERSGSNITLQDMGSTYGTYLNDIQVKFEPMPLKDGDEIRLGPRTKIQFKMKKSMEEDSPTMDNFSLGWDEDATQDSI